MKIYFAVLEKDNLVRSGPDLNWKPPNPKAPIPREPFLNPWQPVVAGLVKCLSDPQHLTHTKFVTLK